MRVLLVEDKRELCRSLQKLFGKHNIDLDSCHDGEEGLDLALSGEYKVIILDIMLPAMSGVEILQQLRKREIVTPVIMLTARETLEDKVLALDVGADDYLVKPFAFEELLARVRALSRRMPVLLQDRVAVGNTSIDRDSYEVWMGGAVVKTTLKEAKILEKLFLERGKFVSKESMLLILSGRNREIASNNVEVYIHHLRKKFPPERAGFAIETRQGAGYRVLENP